MRHETTPWTNVCKNLPTSQGQRVFVLFNQQIQERHQRSVPIGIPKPNSAQKTQKHSDFACRHIARGALFKALVAQYPDMLLGTENDQTTAEAVGAIHRGGNVNTINGNSFRNMEDTQRFLAPKRKQKWISIKNSSVFSNPDFTESLNGLS